MVKKKFPEWYVEGTPFERNFEQIENRYASAHKLEDGTFLIVLYDKGLDLTTIEDLASVLLHEYVHVTIWNDLEEAIPEEDCNSAVHEMTAYGVEIEQTKIQVSQHLRDSTQYGYDLNYLRGVVFCSADIMADWPWPKLGWRGENE